MRGNASSHKKSPVKPVGHVRVIGGNLRGSKIAVPDSPGLRPTGDRIRETLFNWLAPTIHGARCLDLFAGTGVLGIEAVSRGALESVFVERDARLAKDIEANLARLKVDTARVANVDAIDFLRGKPIPFDVAFVDPPFGRSLWDETLALLASGWIAPGGLVYVESPRTLELRVPPAFALHREGQAGEVRYALYRAALG